MCNKKTYKRLKKLYDFITDKQCSYTRAFDDVVYKYKTFKTKMGDRNVIAYMLGKDIAIGYHDYDDSILFMIVCNTKGKITILKSVCDEMAIFSAIYELECLIDKQREKRRADKLEKLLSYYSPSLPGGYGYFPYGFWNRKD